MKDQKNKIKNIMLVLGGVALGNAGKIVKAIATILASVKCWGILTAIAVILISAYLMFTNKKIKKEINLLGRKTLFTIIVVVALFAGIKCYMSHFNTEEIKGDDTVVVEETPEEVKDEPIVEENQGAVVENETTTTTTTTTTTSTSNDATVKPEEVMVATHKADEVVSETIVKGNPENENNEFELVVPGEEANVKVIVEEKTETPETKKVVEEKKEVVIENKEESNTLISDEVKTPEEKEDDQKQSNQPILNQYSKTEKITFEEDEVVEETPSNVSFLDVDDNKEEVVEETTNTVVEDTTNKVVEETTTENTTVEEEIKEEKIEEVKEVEITVRALDGYNATVGSSAQFEINDSNATIDGLDGFDYSFNNGLLNIECGDEATVLTIEVSNGSSSVSFDLTINGIVG